MFASPQIPSFSAGASSSFATTPQRPNQSFGLGSSFAIGSPPAAGSNTSISFGGNMSVNTPTPVVPAPAPAPVAGSSGSPVFQSPSGNKFPAGGGPVIFTPQSTAPSKTTVGMGISSGIAAQASPYHYPGSASSFLQSPPHGLGSAGGGGGGVGYQGPLMYTQSPYSSTMIGGAGGVGIGGHPGTIAVSPIAHGYGVSSPVQVANSNVVQPFGSYGARAMSGSYSFHQGSPTYYHPREDVIAEPMHCSPVGQAQSHPIGSPQGQGQYHPLHRNLNSPPRPQYLPAYLTGVDAVAAVQTRPRRVFDRSPSTSPPILGSGTGGKSPSKAKTWGHGHHESLGHGQPSASGDHQTEGGVLPGGGGYTRRSIGQGPNRQLRFADMSHMQSTMEGQEEKEKPKKSGPPIHGFGFGSSEVSTFLSSLISKENTAIPGAAIAQEAMKNAGMKSPVAESNWITVFGFPAAAASFIYTHFAQFGSIIQSKCNPGGNWLHIQYASVIQARRALACNGKVLGGTIMVGVISSPKEVIEMFDKSTDSASTTGQSQADINPGPSSSVKSPLQEKNTDSTATSRAGIRPLVSSQVTSPGGDKGKTAAFVSPSSSNFTSPKSSSSQSENIPLPTTSSGILTKAMEYMFGW